MDRQVEAGLYDTPYEHSGRLTYEMWRACRLIVDTGIHTMGWSRERAMDLLASSTALSLHEVRTKTDRYISGPGQALAYKIGEMEISRLRGESENGPGPNFDLRAFHDEILWHGTVPLTVMRDQIGWRRVRCSTLLRILPCPPFCQPFSSFLRTASTSGPPASRDAKRWRTTFLCLSKYRSCFRDTVKPHTAR